MFLVQYVVSNVVSLHPAALSKIERLGHFSGCFDSMSREYLEVNRMKAARKMTTGFYCCTIG